MWGSNTQTDGKRGRSPIKSMQSVQNLSPFVRTSSAESTTSASSSSTLPSGVRYIRQTPTITYRSRSPSASSTTPKSRVRDKTPTKTLRFADPLGCSRDHSKDVAKDVKTKTVTKQKSFNQSTEKSVITRPVITTDETDSKVKSHSLQTVAVSPASRQRSPIFTVIDFGDHSKQVTDNKETQTSAKKQSLRSMIKKDKQSIASTAKDHKTQSSSVSDKQSFESKAKNCINSPNSSEDGEKQCFVSLQKNGIYSASSGEKTTKQKTFVTKTSKSSSSSTTKCHKQSSDESEDNRSPKDKQTMIKTEIKGPNGAVKSSSVMAPNVTNGSVHRNTLTIPLQSDKKCDQNRLSVNVKVAVGLDCNASQLRESKKLCEDSNYDEIDWNPNDRGDDWAVRVAVRLRPMPEEMYSQKPVIDMNGNTVRIIHSDNEKYNRLEFGFDECLNSSDRDLFEFADQDRVFVRMGEPLIERSLIGYNVCLFAYGQTGSGKTYTMMGTDAKRGVIPRFVHELYKRLAILSDVEYCLDVSYCEIYNEKIYDLLSDDKNKNKKILRIREHPQKGPYVENLTEHVVDDERKVMELLEYGNRRRAIGSTTANDHSSRSHSIFTLILQQLRNSDQMGLDMSCRCVSRINLIDLAGSERVGSVATTGERFKEGSLINKSLMNLGKVISKLATKSEHIPYRDSALTWLLKDSLGGNSSTSMIATISAAKCHLEETLSTLRYAATARNIVNYVHINEDPKSRKIRELLEVIESLKSQQMDGQVMGWDNIPKSPESSDSSNEKTTEIKTKTIETFSKSTNTSFVTDRRTSTKGTDPSISHTEKKTCSIATNTSFVKKPKLCSTGTEAHVIPKPKTVSTATEMSIIKTTEMSTETTVTPSPTYLDLLRAQQLEDQQKQLLDEIKKQKKKFFSKSDTCAQSWYESVERSDTNSDNYYECVEDMSKPEAEDNEDFPALKKEVKAQDWGADDCGSTSPKKKEVGDNASAEDEEWEYDDGNDSSIKKGIDKKSDVAEDWEEENPPSTEKGADKASAEDWGDDNWDSHTIDKEVNSNGSVETKDWGDDSGDTTVIEKAVEKTSVKASDDDWGCDDWADNNASVEAEDNKGQPSVKEKGVDKTSDVTEDWGEDNPPSTEKGADKASAEDWGDDSWD